MSVVNTAKHWLQLFRAHTVILEAPMAFIGAAIGLGTVADPRVGLWLLFGACYHIVGYGMNSYVDWKKGFDKDDPRKQHHPLNTGDIKPENAKKVIYGLTIGLFAFLLALTYSKPSAVGLSAVMVGSGLAYNYLGKYTRLKFVPIAVAHTLVFFIPYYMYASTVENWVLFMTAAYFIHHVYQIAISGDLKDILQDEASLLQDMGMEVSNGEDGIRTFSASMFSLTISYSLAIIQIFTIVTSASLSGISMPNILITGTLSAGIIITTDLMLRQGVYVRHKRLRWISMKEFIGYAAIHSVAISVIDPRIFVLLLVGMVVYLSTVSKFIWGTYLVPKV